MFTNVTKLVLVIGLVAILSPSSGRSQGRSDTEPTPGVTDTEIKLGTSFPLSGAWAARTVDFGLGSRSYFEKVNSAGGIFGRKIKVIQRDDEYDPAKAVANTEHFIQNEKVFALFGYFGTRIAKVVSTFVKKFDIPFVGPIAASYTEFADNPTKNTFFLKSAQEDAVRPLVEYALKDLKLNSIGVFYQYDETGIPGRTALFNALKAHGLNIVGDGKYARDQEEDINLGFEAILAAKPKAVLIMTSPKPAALFVKKCNEKGYKPIILALSVNASMGKDIEKDGFKSYFALSFPLSTETQFPLIKQFREDMKPFGEDHINESSIQGYISARILVKALEETGKNLTRAKFIQAMEYMNDVDFGGMKVSFSEKNHEAVRSIFVVKTENGKLVRVNK